MIIWVASGYWRGGAVVSCEARARGQAKGVDCFLTRWPGDEDLRCGSRVLSSLVALRPAERWGVRRAEQIERLLMLRKFAAAVGAW